MSDLNCRHLTAVCIGIDPGVTGGICVVNAATGRMMAAQRTPILPVTGKKQYNAAAMRDILLNGMYEVRLATIEKVGVHPHDGKVGCFNFGVGYGLWIGLMVALSIPHIEVSPQRWQARMLAGLPRGGSSKASAMRAANSLFPTLELTVKADSGIADSALIAEFGRRIQTGKEVD